MSDDLNGIGSEPPHSPDDPALTASQQRPRRAARPPGAMSRLRAPENRSKVVLAGGLLVAGLVVLLVIRHESANIGVQRKVDIAKTPGGVSFESGQVSTPAFAQTYQESQTQQASQAYTSGESYAPGYTQAQKDALSITATRTPKPAPAPAKLTPQHFQTAASSSTTTSAAPDPNDQYMLAELTALNHAGGQDTGLKVDYVKTRQQSQVSGGTTMANGMTGRAGTATEAAKTAPMAATSTTGGTPVIGPGKLFYAVMGTSVDSDQPGPVLATLEDGPFANATLLGNYTRHGDAVVIEFTVMTLPNQASIPIKAIAVNADTNRTAVATSYNNHDFDRFAWLLGGAFLQGVGQSAQQGGTTVTSSLGGFAEAISPRSLGQDALNSLGTVGQTLGQIGEQEFQSIKPTVRVKDGFGVGILFLKPVLSDAVETAMSGHEASGGASNNITSGIAASAPSANGGLHLAQSPGGYGQGVYGQGGYNQGGMLPQSGGYYGSTAQAPGLSVNAYNQP